jgi:RNA polymerase sigma-70 factor (ECF subfamily)
MLAATSPHFRHRTISSETNQVRFQAQTAGTESDRHLVSEYLTGRESAFVEIMIRYHDKIFGTVFALLRNYADAEEITQETFVRAHRRLAKFRGDSSLAMWLYRIAAKLSRSRYGYLFRRLRRESVPVNCALSSPATAMLADMLAGDGANPALELEAPEFAFLMDQCFEMLSAPHREILTLHNCFHRSYDEIGAVLGINAAAVKNRIAGARMELRLLVAKVSSARPPRGSADGAPRL